MNGSKRNPTEDRERDFALRNIHERLSIAPTSIFKLFFYCFTITVFMICALVLISTALNIKETTENVKFILAQIHQVLARSSVKTVDQILSEKSYLECLDKSSQSVLDSGVISFLFGLITVVFFTSGLYFSQRWQENIEKAENKYREVEKKFEELKHDTSQLVNKYNNLRTESHEMKRRYDSNVLMIDLLAALQTGSILKQDFTDKKKLNKYIPRLREHLLQLGLNLDKVKKISEWEFQHIKDGIEQIIATINIFPGKVESVKRQCDNIASKIESKLDKDFNID